MGNPHRQASAAEQHFRGFGSMTQLKGVPSGPSKRDVGPVMLAALAAPADADADPAPGGSQGSKNGASGGAFERLPRPDTSAAIREASNRAALTNGSAPGNTTRDNVASVPAREVAPPVNDKNTTDEADLSRKGPTTVNETGTVENHDGSRVAGFKPPSPENTAGKVADESSGTGNTTNVASAHPDAAAKMGAHNSTQLQARTDASPIITLIPSSTPAHQVPLQAAAASSHNNTSKAAQASLPETGLVS